MIKDNLIPVEFMSLENLEENTWPVFFSCRPLVGDYVENSKGIIMKIRSIIHKKVYYTSLAGKCKDIGLAIELIKEK